MDGTQLEDDQLELVGVAAIGQAVIAVAQPLVTESSRQHWIFEVLAIDE